LTAIVIGKKYLYSIFLPEYAYNSEDNIIIRF